jgi:hypothetical protein
LDKSLYFLTRFGLQERPRRRRRRRANKDKNKKKTSAAFQEERGSERERNRDQKREIFHKECPSMLCFFSPYQKKKSWKKRAGLML